MEKCGTPDLSEGPYHQKEECGRSPGGRCRNDGLLRLRHTQQNGARQPSSVPQNTSCPQPRKGHREIDTGDGEVGVPHAQRKKENAQEERSTTSDTARSSQTSDTSPSVTGGVFLTSDTSQNLRTRSGLKSKGGLASCGVDARWCFGQSPASFGVVRGRRGGAQHG